MGYRLAPSLTALRSQINGTWPTRDRESDGWVGDTSHSRRRSDHNPDARGWVHAIDVDRDGIDTHKLIDIAVKDRRVNFVIFNGVIYSRVRGFAPAKYTGPNPHRSHVHISVLHGEPAMDARSWGLPALAPAVKIPQALAAPAAVPMIAPDRAGDEQMVRRMQRALHVDADGIWGPGTDFAVNAVRVASQEDDPRRFGVRTVQRIVGVEQDDQWGPRSAAALTKCVTELQHCWGCTPDGDWGPATMDSCARARGANFRA